MNKLLRKVFVGILVIFFVVSCASTTVQNTKEQQIIKAQAETESIQKEKTIEEAPAAEKAPASKSAHVAEPVSVVETPATEPAPVVEAPAAEPAPVVETPATESAPVVETPAAGSAPVVETPAAEPAPVVEAPAAEPAPVVEAPAAESAPVVEAPAAEVKAEEPVYSETLAYGSLSTKVEVYSTHASLMIPTGVTADDILAVVEMLNASYKNEASLVTYAIEGDTLVLTYPEQSDEFLLSAVEVLRTQAIAYIEGLAQKASVEAVPAETAPVEAASVEAASVEAAPAEAAPVEVASVEAAPAETAPAETAPVETAPVETAPVETAPVETAPVETAPVETAPVIETPLIRTTFSYRDIAAEITAYSTHATIVLPQGMTSDDLHDVMTVLSAKISADGVFYSLDGNTLSLSYPKMTAENLESVYALLRSEIEPYIDRVYESMLPRYDVHVELTGGKLDASYYPEEPEETMTVAVGDSITWLTYGGKRFGVDFNGGTLQEGVTVDSLISDLGNGSVVAPDLARDGYVFFGWENKRTGEIDRAFTVTFDSVVDGDVFIAQFEKIILPVTTYVMNVTADGVGLAGYPKVVDDEESVALPTPEKEFYTFDGFLDGDKVVSSVSFDENSASDLTLEAVWTPVEYSITYDEEGVEYREKPVEVVEEEPVEAISAVEEKEEAKNPDHYNIEDEFTLLPLNRDKYIFRGWIEEGEESYLADPDYRFEKGTHGDKVLVSVWQPKTYTITYILPLEGASFSGPESYVYGSGDIVIGAPDDVAGFVFLGWKEAASDAEPSLTYTIDSLRGEDIVLEALWTPEEYSIVYNEDGVEYEEKKAEAVVEVVEESVEEPKNPDHYNVLDEFTLLPANRDHYIFMGWIEEGEESYLADPEYRFEMGTQGDKTMVSVWMPKTYSISYILHVEKAVFEGPESYVYGSGDVLIPSPESIDGLEFLGWRISGSDEEPSLSYAVDSFTGEDIVLEAVWKSVDYTITYDLDGGKLPEGASNPERYNVMSDTFTLTAPERKGYRFVGWQYEGMEKVNTMLFSVSFTADGMVMTLDVYEDHVNISMPFADEEIIDLVEYVVSECFPVYRTEVLDSEIRIYFPAETTHDFEELVDNLAYELGIEYVEDEEPVEKIADSITVEKGSIGNLSFKAVWEVIYYNIYYDEEGVLYRVPAVREEEPSNPAVYTVNDAFTLVNPSRTGYDFVGWIIDGEEVTLARPVYEIENGTVGDRNLLAVWKEKDYSITYDLAGGEVEDALVTSYTYSFDSVILPTPVRNGYTFAGWFDETEGKYISKISSYSGRDFSLRAVWKVNTYSVSYRLNGGELEMYEENPSSYTVEDTLEALSNPVRKGYTFMGWYEGSGRYTRKMSLSSEYTIDVTKADDIVLSALWEPVNYTLTYVLDGGSYRYEIENPASYTIEDDTIIANPYRDGFDFTGWVIAGDRSETHTVDMIIEAGTTGNMNLIATWKKSTVGLGVVTEKQKNLIVYGKDNIERPDWVVELPESSSYYYEKVYVETSENVYEAAETAKAKGAAQFAMRKGTVVNNTDKNLNGTPYMMTSLKTDATVRDIEVVELWIDSEGGTWVLMRTPR